MHHLLEENKFEIRFLVLENKRGWFFETREGSEKIVILGVLDNCIENRRKLDMRRLTISTNVSIGSISCQQRVQCIYYGKILWRTPLDFFSAPLDFFLPLPAVGKRCNVIRYVMLPDVA